MMTSASMTIAADALVRKVIARLNIFRRQRLCMSDSPLASRHCVNQQPCRCVDYKSDDEQDQPEFDERVAVNFGSGFGEFVGDGRCNSERRLEQRCGNFRAIA